MRFDGALVILAACAASSTPANAAASKPVPIVTELDVPATPEIVWEAWTTENGAKSFFAPEVRIEPRVGGAYEIYFLPQKPAGLRGSETATILAFEPPKRLMFSWNAPEEFGTLRNQLTVVEVEVEPRTDGGSHITLTHSGWGRGEKWSAVRDYFAKAWPYVLAKLGSSFDH